MMFHFYSDYPASNPDTIRRQAVARKTWTAQPWEERPVPDEEVPRRNCSPPMPYIRDLFNAGCENRDSDDIGVFTNSDICVRSDCAKAIESHLSVRDCGYAFRRDFSRLDAPLSDDAIATGFDYCGTDLFAFKVAWWKRLEPLWPDLLLGREGWDACMRVLMEKTTPNKGLAMVNLIYHERHNNGWEAPHIRYALEGQLHNLQTAYHWLIKMGHNPGDFGIR